jgi:prepilin-type N-terminal cleavage/methylation domain-containing protein
MRRGDCGFTLLELIVALVLVGIIAAMGTANIVAAQKRAREASLKANMHSFQLAAEDFGLQHPAYASVADSVAALLPMGGAVFCNPYTKTPGNGQAWIDQPAWRVTLTSASTQPGIVSYGDSACALYQIVGRTTSGDLPLRLTNGT